MKETKEVVKLKKPINIGGQLTSELALREPTAKDFRRTFSKKNVDKFSHQQLMMQLAAELAGISDDEFDLLCLSDTTAMIEAVDRFT
ncbi:MAG: phage tail assembly protein [Cyanobacteria bacterium J06638_7]